MKRLLIAAAASLLIFGGQAEASSLDTPLQLQEVGKWAHFRDKHLLGRETENERRDRKEWERRHRDDYRHDDKRRHRDDYRYVPPNPPPRYRDGKRYYPPAPPRYGSPDRHRYAPPPPPTRYR